MIMWNFSPAVRQDSAIPAVLWRRSENAPACRDHDGQEFPVVIACASEILGADAWRPPPGVVTSETRYLIIADVPIPAMARLSSVFDVRRPEQRMHITLDRRVIRRLLIAQCRDFPMEGVADAYLIGRSLYLLQGDFSFRAFPVDKVQGLSDLDPIELVAFEVDEDGSFLHWPGPDLYFGVSQLLQAVDPSYLADVEVRRFPASAATGALIADLRENRGLRQRDIEGLSERHVRRIERGIARLTGDSAIKLASALGLVLDEFLTLVASAVTADRSARAVAEELVDSEGLQSRVSESPTKSVEYA